MPNYLRKASKNDSGLIAAIQAAAYHKSWTERQIMAAIENQDVWLAGQDGFIVFELIPPECEISMVAVNPSAQRRGIGLKLVQAVVENCLAKSIHKIFLEVEESNLAAIELYKKLGFKEISQRKDYYGAGRNATLMLLQLMHKPTN